MPKKLDTAEDNWRDWLRAGILSGINSAAYASGMCDEGFD